MKKLSVIVAVALGTFVACNLATAQDAGSKPKRGTILSVDDQVDKLKNDLSLKDDQVSKVKAVIEERHNKYKALKSDTSLDQQQRAEKAKAIMQDSHKQMKAILTDEQWKKYQEMFSLGDKKADKKAGKKKAGKKSE